MFEILLGVAILGVALLLGFMLWLLAILIWVVVEMLHLPEEEFFDITDRMD